MQNNRNNRLVAGLGLVAVGAIATVGWVRIRIENARDLRRLKAMLGSEENVVAKIALAELTARNWLRDGSLRGVQLEKANLAGADMFVADLREANLEFANLSRVYLAHSKLTDAVIGNADLSDADLSFANLQGVDFACATLEGANLDGARLQGAILAHTNLKNAHLGSAIFDETTVLPDAEFVDYDANQMPRYSKHWSSDVDMNRYTDPEHADFWQPKRK